MSPLKRKILSFTLISFCLFVFSAPVFFAFAAEYQLLAPSIIIDKNNTQPAGYGFKDYAKTAYLMMFVLVISATVFYFILGGLEYILSDIPNVKVDGMSKIQHALLGLGIALSSYLLLNIINPDLLLFNFDLTLAP